jgi:hypothetical protein
LQPSYFADDPVLGLGNSTPTMHPPQFPHLEISKIEMQLVLISRASQIWRIENSLSDRRGVAIMKTKKRLEKFLKKNGVENI